MIANSLIQKYKLIDPVFKDKKTVDINRDDIDLIDSLEKKGIKMKFGLKSGNENRITYEESCNNYGQFTVFFNGDKNHAILAGKTVPSAGLFGRVDFDGDNACCMITERSIQATHLKVYIWGSNSFFYWGPTSYANGAKFEIQGDGHYIVVSGDSIFSDNIWVSNSDMHPIFDLDSGEKINKQVDIYFEKHVWVGRDAGILCAEKIGYGSIIGAKSLVKNDVEPQSCYAGVPAKKIRSNVTWG